jgi:flagellar hook assembly protein FlgD
MQLNADLNGRTGRTRKTSTVGCSCHGSISSATTVTIAGPDTVLQGTTASYTLTISNPAQSGAGLDIATRLGALVNTSNLTHLSGGEITHSNNIAMTNHTVTIPFNYTAPSTPGTDTIWAQGNATNSNGSSSGDVQNYAPEKRIIVRGPNGIENNQTPVRFVLNQNYPNPFNPTTTISFELPKTSGLSLTIFDIAGKKVDELANGTYAQGKYSFMWNASNVSRGIYYYGIIHLFRVFFCFLSPNYPFLRSILSDVDYFLIESPNNINSMTILSVFLAH